MFHNYHHLPVAVVKTVPVLPVTKTAPPPIPILGMQNDKPTEEQFEDLYPSSELEV
jgi:hypothetical protein